MNESILTSVKEGLMGVTEDYEAFDPTLIVHTNSALATLEQLGVGPDNGFAITGKDETWGDFLGDNEILLNSVKEYVTNKVKLSWDPPSSSFVLSSLEKQTSELEWRIAVKVDTINNRKNS